MATEELHRIRVLQAFSTASRLGFDELLELTGIEESALSVTLSNLVAERVLRCNGLQWMRTVVEAHIPQFVGEDKGHLPLLLGLTEGEALNRIRMLGYMKNKLICDWHPVIDKLIGDYTRGLEIVESLRYGASGDVDERSGEN